MIYKRRLIEQITPYLNTDNILVLHGSRQVGKTSIMLYLKALLDTQKKLTIYLDLEEMSLLDLLNSGIDNFLSYLLGQGFELEKIQKENERLYVFIDEIQYLNYPSSFLKLIADHHKYLQIITSGSSSFEIKSKFKDSLVGRTVSFEVFALSFPEFLDFKGVILNLEKTSTKPHIDRLTSLYQEFVTFGAYPKIVLESDIVKKETYLKQIIQTYVQKDIKDLATVVDVTKFNNLLQVLASQSGNLLNVANLAGMSNLSRQTIEKYIFILEQTYILKLVHPFSQSIKIEITKNPKIFFYDTGIVQLLWLKKFSPTLLGNVFETSIFSELAKVYDKNDIYFWRNKNQNEIDFILKPADRIVPIEVKLNFQQFKTGSINHFLTKYSIETYKVASLYGNKIPHGAYPWEIGQILDK